MQQDKYTIGWNTFQNHLKETQIELYHEKYFADVTLVSDDMVSVQAHKTILCSASPVFKQLLMIYPSNTNSILYLKGIEHEELESILQFIYLGEAKVYESRIQSFMSASTELNIKELKKQTVESAVDERDGTNDHKYKENEPSSESVIENNTQDMSILNTLQSLDCPECNKTFSRVRNMRAHYERSHSESKPNFPCNQCGKVFNQKGNLDLHIKGIHMGIKYMCDICDYQTAQKGNLATHIRSKH